MDSLEDLHIALSVAAAAQTAIQHADTKAALLLTGLAGAAALASDQPGLVAAAVDAGTAAAIAAMGLGSAAVAGVAGAGWHLGRCLAPRLATPKIAAGNRFALPSLGAHRRPPAAAPVDRQRDDAWAAAQVLAGVAMDKYRAIRASLPWVLMAAAASFGWLCLGLGLGAR
jgi:hypothetical protein